MSNLLKPVAEGLTLQGITPPLAASDYKLIAFDMDSTLINIESLDEIAAFAGKGKEVAAITEAAMRGEITNYKDSLRRRVAMIAGTPVTVMERVYQERLQLNPGAVELIAAAKKFGWKTMVVSGGFTFFTERIKTRLGLDFAHSNVLAEKDGVLTGELLGEIVDGEGKRMHVAAACKHIGCTMSQAIAVGDGANDLPMMRSAGLSVAYHAKPAVRGEAKVGITQGGLDRLLEVFA
ncbi:MAG: phosphoserine phosphatase SerB [Burkholderiaceae bacterium]